jgi:hypothetical protein
LSIIFESFNHADVLESGFVEAAPDFLGVFDDVALVVGPSEAPGFGFHD